MNTFKICKGLKLPILGEPDQKISNGAKITSVALLGDDYIGMRPTILVKPGDSVKVGQCIFTDKKNPGVKYVAPGSGKVRSIERGDKRKFLALIIDLDGSDSAESFPIFAEAESLDRKKVQENLVNSGMWTALRTRPYSKVPAVGSAPSSIFVTAMDTNPLAANPELVISENKREFSYGVKVLAALTDGKVHLCRASGSQVPGDHGEVAEFAGPHPAGLAGTHIHFIDPVSTTKTVWSIGYQDVIGIGKLFLTGSLSLERVVSLAGPKAKNPRIVRTRLGASLADLCAAEMVDGEPVRKVSGSVLHGHNASGVVEYLGRYHNQVSLIAEGGAREFLGWKMPGLNKFSVKPVFAAKALIGKKFAFNSLANGSPRAIVPTGNFESVMPLDILPTFLAKSLLMVDTEMAQKLGALELDEEDLGPMTFVCSGKNDYGNYLRQNLTKIEEEG